MLEPVGLGSDESAVYLRLLARPRSGAAELAELLTMPVTRVRRALAGLTEAGLVTRIAAATPARYMPAQPDLAIDALALRRQEQLERLRAHARELTMAMPDPPRGAPSDLVELVEGNAAVMQHLARMQHGAEREVAIVDCPPYLTGVPVDNPEEWQALRRGVRYRAIYHAPTIATPGRMDEVLDYVSAGEEARTLPDIHLKMLVADRRIGIMPLSVAEADTGVRVLIRPSPLLDMMVTCFDMLWERATPLAATPSQVQATSGASRVGTAPGSNGATSGGNGAAPAGDGAGTTPGTDGRGGNAAALGFTPPGSGVAPGAVPIDNGGEPAGLPGEAGGPSDRDRQLLAMLAAGMKDRATARALGVTERTVTRRITQLMQHLGAETRFQAALQAARRGWL
ncbi:MAG: helix-turn-helix domain-containing protein [Micromonosporaceae bacterium]